MGEGEMSWFQESHDQLGPGSVELRAKWEGRERRGRYPRTGGTLIQSHLPIYEDFQPHFELKKEQESHIVQVHLPGFAKEQAEITYMDNTGMIRVYGQRPLGDNKWRRFNQTFPVQQNCDANKMHDKFSNGILTITIPKKVITRTATAEPVQERETGKRSKEARALLKILEREKNKSRCFSKPKEVGSIAARVMAAAKELMKNLSNGMNDEEKQLLIHTGAAVLVLIALGASASYSLWSSGKGKN